MDGLFRFCLGRGKARSLVCGCFLHPGLQFFLTLCDLKTIPMPRCLLFFSVRKKDNSGIILTYIQADLPTSSQRLLKSLKMILSTFYQREKEFRGNWKWLHIDFGLTDEGRCQLQTSKSGAPDLKSMERKHSPLPSFFKALMIDFIFTPLLLRLHGSCISQDFKNPDFPFQHHGQRVRGEELPRAAHMIPLTLSTTTACTTPSVNTHTHTHTNSLTPPLTHLPSLPWGRSCTAQLHGGAASEVGGAMHVVLAAVYVQVNVVETWWYKSCDFGSSWVKQPSGYKLKANGRRKCICVYQYMRVHGIVLVVTQTCDKRFLKLNKLLNRPNTDSTVSKLPQTHFLHSCCAVYFYVWCHSTVKTKQRHNKRWERVTKVNSVAPGHHLILQSTRVSPCFLCCNLHRTVKESGHEMLNLDEMVNRGQAVQGEVEERELHQS